MLQFITAAFQPILDLETSTIAMFEALLRVRGDKSQRGHIELLDIAERYGFICDIDLAVLNHILAGLDYIDTPIAVNVSPYTIKSHMPELIDAIQKRQAHASRLVVDLSNVADESVWPHILQFAAKVRHFGVRFALDDSGPIDKQIMYVNRLKPAFVKIDKEILGDVLANGRPELIQPLANQVHAYGGHLLAGHVEDIDSFDALRRVSIRFAQGYGIGRPARVSGAAYPSNASKVAVCA